MNFGQSLGIVIAAMMFSTDTFSADSSMATNAAAVERGEKFLAGLFDPQLELLPEYRGSKTYWLFHDNYLAAKVLDSSRPDLAACIRASLAKHGFTNSGKIEVLFHEAPQPLPFRAYLLTNVVVAGGKTIRTEIVTEKVTKDWENYADLLLLAAVAQSRSDSGAARRSFDQATALWDGKGLADQATKKSQLYATYKLALYLIAAKELRLKPRNAAEVKARLLALQNAEGGWITDYDVSLKPRGLANVETSCLAILALHE